MAMTIRQAAPLNGAAILSDDLVAQQLRQDSDHDAFLIDSHRLAALFWIERHMAVSLQRRGWVATFDGFGSDMRLRRTPIAQVDRVTYIGHSDDPIDGAGLWRLIDDRLLPTAGQRWPTATRVVVEFTAGYVDAAIEVPHLRTAALLLIQHLYEGGSLKDVPDTIAMLCEIDRVPVIG
ncbi:hypothetical protein [Sphingomonas sp.]|uniref:hypothetical protein n=1 Tax=Sphingomonas sp. TaxID=28214 RepID=UPI0035B16C07